MANTFEDALKHVVPANANAHQWHAQANGSNASGSLMDRSVPSLSIPTKHGQWIGLW